MEDGEEVFLKFGEGFGFLGFFFPNRGRRREKEE